MPDATTQSPVSAAPDSPIAQNAILLTPDEAASAAFVAARLEARVHAPACYRLRPLSLYTAYRVRVGKSGGKPLPP